MALPLPHTGGWVERREAGRQEQLISSGWPSGQRVLHCPSSIAGVHVHPHCKEGEDGTGR